MGIARALAGATMLLATLFVWAATTQPAVPSTTPSTTAPSTVRQWDIFELTLPGPADGNPFIDVELSAHFTSNVATFTARGFYDGNGVYRVRFMPPAQGRWRFVTRSSRKGLNDRSGDFECVAPAAGNHGPVRVAHTFHFAYADGTPYAPIGTTCYTWVHQPEAAEEQTLATLKQSPFNKVRMCVFPTAYKKGTDEPARFPYERVVNGKFDLARFDVRFFQHMEQQISKLNDRGIEADLILFHPYDKGQMGFDRMSAAADELYLHYIVARLAAYRNVWWSLANEFDLMKEKTDADFDRFFRVVQSDDPSDHLRSIHFSERMYDQSKPWITHVSAQNGMAVDDFGRASLYRDVAGKPVIYDEAKYEGDLERRWGQLSGEQMVMHFWLGTIAGTYVSHGEVLRGEKDRTWTSRGGELRGQSPARIAFLRSILETAPGQSIEPIDRFYETHIGGKPGEFYLIYFGREQPKEWTFELPRNGLEEGMTFSVDVLDTWNMTVTPVEGPPFNIVKHGNYQFHAEGDRKVALPGKPWIVLRLRRIDHTQATTATTNDAE